MSIFGNKEKQEMEKQRQDQKNFAREQMAMQEGMQHEQVQLNRERERQDLTRWQQKLDDELITLKHRLRSEYYNRDQDAWVSKQEKYIGKDGKPHWRDVPPMLNETGIQIVESTVAPLISRNLINSNFDEKRILKMLRSTLHTLISVLGNNFDQYEVYGYKDEHIQDPTDTLDSVINIIKNFIIPAPYRALNDGERKHQRTMRKDSEVRTYTNPDQTEKKKGLFGLGG